MQQGCRLCPRRCGADRAHGQPGVCRAPALPTLARAAAHYGEEPCISGTRGSGAVFFSGCSLGCVFCQNAAISRGGTGHTVTVPQLRQIFERLCAQGVHNLNLVTPTHYADVIAAALRMGPLPIPVVWNSSGYDCAETLRMLEGLVQVWMPDYKYALPGLAGRCSGAPDYPETARAALREMYRQAGPFELDEDGLLRRGVLVRHLVLPGQVENSVRALEQLADTLPPEHILLSLMAQYTPMPGSAAVGGLSRTVTQAEFDRVLLRMEQLGFENGFYQDPSAAGEEMIPEFDLTGL